MTPMTAVFTLLCALLLFLSILRYSRTAIDINMRITFIVIRVLIAALILLCFFEPSFKFSRLAPRKRSVSVLIDNSQSMSLFNPDSSTVPFIDKLKRFSSIEHKNFTFSFSIFGDSLRSFLSNDNYNPADRHSFLPDVSLKSAAAADHIILLSDANWQTNSSLIDKLSARSVFYNPLPSPHQRNSIVIKTDNKKYDSLNVSPILKINLEGYSADNCKLNVNFHEQQRLIKTTSLTLDTGIIDTAIICILPELSPGKHLFRITASFPGDSVMAETFHLQNVPPAKFYYSLIKESPSIDTRFFSLAIMRHPEFTFSEKVSSKTNLLIAFSCSDQTENAISRLPSNGVIAILGCSPECDSFIPVSSDFKLVGTQNSFLTPLDAVIPDELPPPSGILSCPAALSAKRQLLTTVIYRTQKPETTAVAASGIYKSHNTFILNIRDFWRWDFWPMSHNRGEEQPFLFSELLISTFKEMLINSISGTFFAFPYSTVNPDDSAVFALSLPRDIPVPSDIAVILAIKRAGALIPAYSRHTLTTTGASLQTIKSQPLDTGTYIYSCELTSKGRSFHYSDTLTVRNACRELLVRQQNRSLLDEFAQVIPVQSDSLLYSFLRKLSANGHEPGEEYLHITRSWLLLSLLFGLLALEWMLRRKWKLDEE